MSADHPAYPDPVTLLVYDSDAKLIPGKSLTTTLAEAVRIAVEDEPATQLRDVYIATSSGPIEGIEAIRGIYFRDDFPFPRKPPAASGTET
jgi:hypothetical protein